MTKHHLKIQKQALQTTFRFVKKNLRNLKKREMMMIPKFEK